MQVFSISWERNVFFSSKASVQTFKHTSQTAPVETNSGAIHKRLKTNKKILRSTFPAGLLSPTSCPKCFGLQSQILKLHLTPKLKSTLCSLCSWETLASSAFAFQALQRCSRQPSSVSLISMERKQGLPRETQGEGPQHIESTKHLISPANLELREIH